MFSVGYYNKAMVINTINVRRIDFQNIKKLRRLVIQILQNPCGKIIIDIQGVKFIDSQSFEFLNTMHEIANRQKVILEFANVDNEVLELFELVPKAKNYKITKNSYLPHESFSRKELVY